MIISFLSEVAQALFGIREQNEHTDTKERVHYQQVANLQRYLPQHIELY